jgi:hypothetical protein
VKRGVASLFLILFLVNSAGIYLYFIARVITVRQSMMAALSDSPAEKLVRLRLEPSAYREAIAGDREIRIGGRYYDIARTEEVGGKVIVYCLFDEAESNLTAFLERVMDSGESVPAPVTQFQQLIFISPVGICLPSPEPPGLPADRVLMPAYSCLLYREGPPPRG